MMETGVQEGTGWLGMIYANWPNDGSLYIMNADCSTGSCTFSTPGAYRLMLQVRDNSGILDTMDLYAVATPPGSSSGSVIRRMRCHAFAPSTSAAS